MPGKRGVSISGQFSASGVTADGHLVDAGEAAAAAGERSVGASAVLANGMGPSETDRSMERGTGRSMGLAAAAGGERDTSNTQKPPSMQSEKVFYDGIELRVPPTFEDHCIWIRATTTFRSLVVQCPSAKSRAKWMALLQQASDRVTGGMLEKQFSEAARLQRVAFIDQATQTRVSKLETTIHNLDNAVTVARREARLGSRGVSRFEQDSGNTAGITASAAYFSRQMFELRAKSKLEAASLNLNSGFHDKEQQEPLDLFLNTASPDTLWLLLDTFLSVLPMVGAIICLIVTLVLNPPVIQVFPGLVGAVLLTLYRPWVKLKLAEQTVARTQILGKRLTFTGKVFDKKKPQNAFWKLWFYNWCWSVVSCGVSRFIADADFKEAEWLDEHISWEDRTLCSLGVVLAVDYRADADTPGQVKCVIAQGAAAEAGTVAKGDVIIRVDGHSCEASSIRTHLYGTGWIEEAKGMKAKAQGGTTCQLASLKGYDMLIEPFAMTGEILTFDLVRRKATFNLFRGRLELFWSYVWCWCLCVASLGMLTPWAYVRYLKLAHTARYLHLGGFTFNFRGKLSEYISKIWLQNLIYNCLTIGLWSILGFAGRRSAAWADAKVELLAHTDSSHVTGPLAQLTRPHHH